MAVVAITATERRRVQALPALLGPRSAGPAGAPNRCDAPPGWPSTRRREALAVHYFPGMWAWDRSIVAPPAWPTTGRRARGRRATSSATCDWAAGGRRLRRPSAGRVRLRRARSRTRPSRDGDLAAPDGRARSATSGRRARRRCVDDESSGTGCSSTAFEALDDRRRCSALDQAAVTAALGLGGRRSSTPASVGGRCTPSSRIDRAVPAHADCAWPAAPSPQAGEQLGRTEAGRDARRRAGVYPTRGTGLPELPVPRSPCLRDAGRR